MTSLAWTLVGTAGAWLLVFLVFAVALRRRWLSRFRSGFHMSLGIALMGMVFMAASVVGLWGYSAAKKMLDQELAVELQDVGSIIESQVSRDVDAIKSAIDNAGGTLATILLRETPAALEARLRMTLSLRRRVVQMALFDRNGQLMVSAGLDPAREEASRVATAFSLDGKLFVSDAQFSRIYKRPLIVISLPIRGADSVVVGVITAWSTCRPS